MSNLWSWESYLYWQKLLICQHRHTYAHMGKEKVSVTLMSLSTGKEMGLGVSSNIRVECFLNQQHPLLATDALRPC